MANKVARQADEQLRKTKIICTIGPATASFQKMKALRNAGMDLVRLNMSHSSHAEAKKVIDWVNKLNQAGGSPVSVLLDTQGPEIRTGELKNPMKLKTGQIVSLTVRDAELVETQSILVNYEEIVDVVDVGSLITLDNGLLNFEVLEKKGGQLVCRVLDGGTLGSRKHVNLPGIRVNLPAITEKDKRDIQFAKNHGVDFIALSFVREASDIEELRRVLGAKGETIKIIAKIEDRSGVENIHSIVGAADGVMVARGDLGIETNIADLPNIQRRIVHSSAVGGKRCIVATHLLESMIENPIPTRAEVTDVANAVYEGADAVMLSGETSVGKYPTRCVEQIVDIVKRAEKYAGLGYEKELVALDDKQHLAVHAVALAESLRAVGIIVITRRGIMADLVTNARPHSVPIFAFANSNQVRKRLVLNRSVNTFQIPFSRNPDKTLNRAMRMLKRIHGFAAQDKVVVVSDVLADSPSDAIQIRPLGES